MRLDEGCEGMFQKPPRVSAARYEAGVLENKIKRPES